MNRKIMNIYLDVDGTLLTKHGESARHVVEFLEKVTSEYDAYWLTTHRRHGDVGPVRTILAERLPKAALPFLEKIKPTAWNVLKTEAIDFSAVFLWFDDYMMESERAILAQHNALGNWIEINLEANPDQLAEILRDL